MNTEQDGGDLAEYHALSFGFVSTAGALVVITV